jgi:predicted transcriptional regulator of viral defense system
MKKAAQSIDKAILRSIRARPDASVFSPEHFADFGSNDAIRKALSRLVKAGKIRRIRRGLYHLPRPHPIVGQTGPDIMATVRALVEGSHAQWQFTGAYAANALGLSDQVPAKVIILTDGVPRRVALGKLMLVFRHASPRNLLGAGRGSGLVIQALRYLKGSPDMPKHIANLKRNLDTNTKKDLARLVPKLPRWMRPLATEITQA